MHLKLKKFDPASIDDTRIAFVIGKRGTGKSFLCRDLLYHKRKIPMGIVMSGTEEGNGWYGQFVPETFIYNDFDKTVVESMIARQRTMSKRHGKAEKTFLVLDDVLYGKILKEKCMRQLAMNGRHYKIFVLCTAQYLMDAPVEFRTQIDYLFVLREPILANRERLFKQFFGLFPDFSSFCQVMDSFTEDYSCLVLDNTSKSNKIEDVVFWYKARETLPPFKMGCKAYWRAHRKLYNDKWDEEEDFPVAEAQRGGRAKPKLLIKKLN